MTRVSKQQLEKPTLDPTVTKKGSGEKTNQDDAPTDPESTVDTSDSNPASKINNRQAPGGAVLNPKTDTPAEPLDLESMFASQEPIDGDGCTIVRFTPYTREYAIKDRTGLSETSFVIDNPRFTAAMRAQTSVLGIKKFDKKNATKWTPVVAGKTSALTSCTFYAPDGSHPFRYFLLALTLANQYKNDVDLAVAEINQAIRPHKYVLHLSPEDRALVNVTVTFTRQPSGKVRTSGENDDFIKNIFDLHKCGLEQVRDGEDRCYLETFIRVNLCEYAKAFELQIRKEGIKNVSVKVTP
jgi:hypothetical protein